MHERRRIREEVVSILTADASITETVEDSPGLARKAEDLPRVYVYTDGDRVVGERESDSPARYSRETNVKIECVVEWTRAPGTNPSQQLDIMAERVEAALDTAIAGHLGNSVQSFDYVRSTATFEKDGALLMGVLTLFYRVEFRTEHAATLDDYVGADVDYHRDAPGERPDGPHAQDVADVP